MKKFPITHTLKKDFVFSENEVYKKGTPVYMKRHTKHSGFCCNVAFLTKTGRIKILKKSRIVALFQKDLFYPLKTWFTVKESTL